MAKDGCVVQRVVYFSYLPPVAGLSAPVLTWSDNMYAVTTRLLQAPAAGVGHVGLALGTIKVDYSGFLVTNWLVNI